MHVAVVPELGVTPTLAVHAELMKFVPVTVMVLPMYAEVGAIAMAVGASAGNMLPVEIIPAEHAF